MSEDWREKGRRALEDETVNKAIKAIEDLLGAIESNPRKPREEPKEDEK